MRPAILFLVSILPAFAVDGVVVNKTTGKPASDATVTLYKLGQAGMESLESVHSGPDGRFTIQQNAQGGPHLIQTAFDGVTYNHMLPPGTPSSGITLEVYNSSKKPGEAKVAEHFLVFQPSGNQLGVTEGFIFNNKGLTTYNDPEGGTLKFWLPQEANGKVEVKATAPQGMPIDRAAEKTARAGVYKVDFPIKPGETRFDISYSLPYSASATYRGKSLVAPSDPTYLVAPVGVSLEGDKLQDKRVEPKTQAVIYSVRGESFEVKVSGALASAPAGAADSDSQDSGPQIETIPAKIWDRAGWILAIALGILALGFILLYRMQPAPAAPAEGKHGARRRR